MRLTPQPLPANVGLPADNDKTRCEPSGTSCYFLITAASTYATAQKTCSKLGGGGGFLVAWYGSAIKVHSPSYVWQKGFAWAVAPAVCMHLNARSSIVAACPLARAGTTKRSSCAWRRYAMGIEQLPAACIHSPSYRAVE